MGGLEEGTFCFWFEELVEKRVGLYEISKHLLGLCGFARNFTSWHPRNSGPTSRARMRRMMSSTFIKPSNLMDSHGMR